MLTSLKKMKLWLRWNQYFVNCSDLIMLIMAINFVQTRFQCKHKNIWIPICKKKKTHGLNFYSSFEQEFEVTLTKGEKGLGFTVAGGQQAIGIFYVKDVLYNPALSDGRIQQGDRLIAVSTRRRVCLLAKRYLTTLNQIPICIVSNPIFDHLTKHLYCKDSDWPKLIRS